MTKVSGMRLARWLGLLIMLAATGYFIVELVEHRQIFREIAWTASGIMALIASIVTMVLVIFVGGLIWHQLLRDQGLPTPPLVAVRIVALSQIAKYLPGNVGHMVGQVALARAAGIPVGVSVTTLVMSTVWLTAIGIGVGGPGLVELAASRNIEWLPSITPLGLIILGVGLVFAPWVAVIIMNRFLPRLSARLGNGSPVVVPSLGAAVMLSLGFLLSFLLFGLMLHLQARWLFGVIDVNLLHFTLLFASAWVVGYLVPGAPGGVGVREALMLLLLTPTTGAAVAAALGVTMRVATLLGDGVAFLAGLGLARWDLRRQHASAS